MATAAQATAGHGAPLDRVVALYSVGLSAIYAALVMMQASPVSFYTLDDPYIHMALAENIARGHFGVNLEDVSNPSSSVLWPLLLAVADKLGVLIWAPLLINIVSFALTLQLMLAFALRKLAVPGRSPMNVVLLVGFAVLSFNVFGVIFTGMEHSLHTLVSVAGVIRVIEKRYDRIALVALVASPLLRFEGAAILAFGIVAAIHDRRFVFTAIAAGAASAALGAYFAGMSSLGLPMLPSSVLSKSAVSSNVVDGGGGGMLAALGRNAVANMTEVAAPVFALFAGVFGWAIMKRRGRDQVMAASFLALTVMAFAIGRMDSFSRYEVYIFCVLSVGAIQLFPTALQVVTRKAVFAVALGGALSLLGSFAGLGVAMRTPLAARNIDRQQHQMHRLITECWRAPIAVNDLGWTSLRNDSYALDLAGLGNEQARKARAADAPGWVARIVADSRVEAAAVYTDWFFHVPAEWTHVGDLVLDDPRITPASSTVGIFATRPEAAERLRGCLAQLGAGLPKGASVRMAPPPA